MNTSRTLIALFFLATFQTHAIESFSFDWDDNIMVMVPEIVLIDNATNEEILISTRRFADLKNQIGDGKKYRRKPEDISAIDSNFISNVQKTIEQDPSKWQAPMWKQFTRVLETEEGAAHASIITGRRNSPSAIVKAMQVLRDQGLIKNVISAARIFPVGNKSLFPETVDASAKKVNIMMYLLDKLNALPLGSERVHFWNFSDDDRDNFLMAQEVLLSEKKEGRWPNVRIGITFTGFEW